MVGLIIALVISLVLLLIINPIINNIYNAIQKGQREWNAGKAKYDKYNKGFVRIFAKKKLDKGLQDLVNGKQKLNAANGILSILMGSAFFLIILSLILFTILVVRIILAIVR